jgi:hypothetical protein
MELLGGVGHVESCPEMVLVSVQCRCMVRTKHTIDLGIVLGALDGTPR